MKPRDVKNLGRLEIGNGNGQDLAAKCIGLGSSQLQIICPCRREWTPALLEFVGEVVPVVIAVVLQRCFGS